MRTCSSGSLKWLELGTEGGWNCGNLEQWDLGVEGTCSGGTWSRESLEL